MGGPLILLLAAAHAADLAPVAQAEVVFLGTLKAQERGSTGLSMPPVYTGTLTFTDVEALRGTAPEALKYSLRQPDAPEWPAGKRFLAAASDGMLKLVVEATDAVVAEARETAKLPIGWSPGHSPWPDERPPWLAGSGLVLTVEQVPPEVPQKYKNDYGDGKFALTLTNPGAEPVTVEALRRDANGILWEQSVLASAHRFSDAPLPEGTEAVVLGPGEEVEAVLDTLKLDGVDWPRGGARVPFTFSLGELAASSFFYYTSSLHDPMRENR